MPKDVPSFRWPAPFNDGGKLYRFLLETATEHADRRDETSYVAVQEQWADFKERIGQDNVETAAAIAFAYLGHLARHGVIPPLMEGQYR